MDKGGQERAEVDAAVVPPLQGQPGTAPVVRPGLQPGELPTPTGDAAVGADVDADDAAQEADQDRGQGRPPRQGGDVQLAEVASATCVFTAILGRSVDCERRRDRVECSSRPAGSAIEPMRAGMVRREGRERGRGTSGRGGPGVVLGVRRAAGPHRRHFVIERGMRLVSNLASARPGVVSATEIDSHLGNPS